MMGVEVDQHLVVVEATSASIAGNAETLPVRVRTSPNPFNESIRIQFTLPSRSDARMGIYDARGGLVRALAEQALPAGPQSMVWDGRDSAGLPSSTYFYELRLDGKVLDSGRALLLK